MVEDSLAGLEKDQVFVIPGFRYQALVWTVNRIPRVLRRKLMLAVARRTGRIAARQP